VWLTLSSLPAAAPLDRRMGRPSETATVSAPLPPPPPPAPPPSTDPAPTVKHEAQPNPLFPRGQPEASPGTARVLAPLRRAPAPRVTHTAPPKTVAKPTPPPAGAERRLELGRLSVNAMPWGNVYIDGQLLGTVPLTDVPIWPGTHSLRVEREGFQPYERTFEITSGQRLKITDIVLREFAP